MLCIATRPFRWYPDGFTVEALAIGDKRDFGTSTSGMCQADMIAPDPEFLALFAEKPVEMAVFEPVLEAPQPPVEAPVETPVESQPKTAETPVAPVSRGPGRPRKH